MSGKVYLKYPTLFQHCRVWFAKTDGNSHA